LPRRAPRDGVEECGRLGSSNPLASPKYSDVISFGCYAEFVQMYLDLFPRRQILVIEFEEFIQTPAGIEELFEFLGVPVPPGYGRFRRLTLAATIGAGVGRPITKLGTG
jgi:hypothetical protein